jgi:hypothetical protein
LVRAPVTRVAVCRVPAGFSRRPTVGDADLHDRGTDRRPGGFERTPPILSLTGVRSPSYLPSAHASPLHGRLSTGLSAPTCAPANVRAPHSSHPPPSYSSQGTSADVLRSNCDDVRASGRTSAPPCAAVAYLALFDLTLGASFVVRCPRILLISRARSSRGTGRCS